MKVYFTQVERILNTLPIGYYAGRRVPAVLSKEAETSFIDIIEQKITVSFPQIEFAVENIEDESIGEQIVRNLLYHEVSHAILTNKALLYEGISKKDKDILNIFEDERIETIMKRYYHDVDFKRNVELINNWEEMKKTKPRDAMDMFYRVVRFRVGKEEWLQNVDNIIEDNFDGNCVYMYVWPYRSSVKYLYEKIAKEFEKMNDDELSEVMNSGSGMSSDGGGSDKKSGYADISNEGAEESESEQSIEKENDGDERIRDAIESILEERFGKYGETNPMTADILSIISNFNRKNSGGSAIASHSGIINPRLVGRPDYRIFERKSSEKGANKFCSVHINLFLDESGSYCGNVPKTNQLIAALAQAEKIDKNFTFDIVYCGMGERIVKNKCNRLMDAHGGNDLDEKIFEIYRRVQKPGTYNYNIVLFDGDAFTDSYNRKNAYRNFGAFNHNNCTIISDYQNKDYINTYAPSAKRIFTYNYVEELQKNIVSTLRLAFR